MATSCLWRESDDLRPTLGRRGDGQSRRVIAQDYAKASQIAQENGFVVLGASVEEMKNPKKVFEHSPPTRIIEVGKPITQTEGDVTSVKLPVKLELEVKGMPKEVLEFKPYVRPVPGQPDRWDISGGI